VPITTKGGVVQEFDAQATVVDASGISGGLTTTIARSDVQSALQETEIPPLVLDIRRGDETSSVALTWKRDDLERLLNEASGDQIQLTFDPGTIGQAFDDVEAHGLREKAAVVAVAVAGAAALAGGASAMPMDTGGGGQSAAPVALAGPSGVHLGDTTAVASQVDDPAIATAINESVAAMQGPSGAHLGDTTALPSQTDDPAIATAIADSVAYSQGPSGAHIGDTTAPNLPAPTAQTGPSGVHIGDAIDNSPAAYASDDGTSLGDIGSGVAAVGAGAAILIVGAAFAATSRRRVPAT
jgi:hypothetical protein